MSGLAARVVNRHGSTNPELVLIQSNLARLTGELTDHLAEEETVGLPMIQEVKRKGGERRCRATGVTGFHRESFGPAYRGHNNAGVLLAEIRSLSRDFVAPEYACTTYHAFYDELREFEDDLHRHVHLENNILFPCAIEEEAASS